MGLERKGILTAENDQVDRNHLEPHASSRYANQQLTETHSLIEVWREMHEEDREYT